MPSEKARLMVEDVAGTARAMDYAEQERAERALLAYVAELEDTVRDLAAFQVRDADTVADVMKRMRELRERAVAARAT